MLPESVKTTLESELKASIKSIKPVGGGSINETARIETSSEIYFIKWNNAKRFPGMFEAEQKGLRLLKKYSGFVIPEVVFWGTHEDLSYIVMTHLEHGPGDWKNAGQLLAAMHKSTLGKFGLEHDNYIGSLHQSNTFHDSWSAFFSNERILPQMKLAIDAGALNKSDLMAAENFCKRLDEIFADEKPSLLHGDLWSGNFMFTSEGPAIFDPAVYWGHREMDIAMTKLFGGFDKEFYNGYNEDYSLEKGWEQRVPYFNLYPLLVHVNLFGGGYVNDVRRILNHFT